MNCWVINVGEPIAEFDGETRLYRYGMLTDRLLARGHSVVRWSSTFRHLTKDFRADEFRSVAGEGGLSFRLLHGCGYQLHRSPRRLWHHALEAREFDQKSRLEARPDVILVSLPTLALARSAVEYGLEADCPVVVDVRDCWPDHYLTILPHRLRPMARPLLFRQYGQLRRLLGNAAGVVAVSETYLNWARRYGADRQPYNRAFPIGYQWPENVSSTVFPASLANAGISTSDFIVLFVGTFTRSYDFNTIVSAARTLAAEKLDDVKFVFVGSGPGEASLQRAQAELPNVRLLGWIKQPEVLAQIVARADVGLCPYRHDCTMSLPNKPFEYMAAGKALLSSLAGEFEGILKAEKMGVHYRSDDAAALAAAVRMLRGDSAATQEMGRRAREVFRQRYTSEQIYPQFAALLEEVAADRAKPARVAATIG